jgi:hypothetical protein
MVLKSKCGDGHSRMPTGVYRVSKNEFTDFNILHSQKVQFSPHDSQNVEISRTVLLLSGEHECAHACFKPFENRMDILRETKAAQIEVQ